jgi:8-oxo-dGTP pyrophosphatase MutT (NUDIX family)
VVEAERGAIVLSLLDEFRPADDTERAAVEQMRQLAAGGDPWPRSLPVHVTGSALIVHPPSRRVLLRWHERMQGWLQVGGHADPGEIDPFLIAQREATEETGLRDLIPWPDPSQPRIVQVAVVPVPAGRGEPAHHHADIRYVLSTSTPDATTPETERARLVWLTFDDALGQVGLDNLRVCLQRVASLLEDEGAA